MSRTSVLMAVIALAAVQPAAADDSGVYIGAGAALVAMPDHVHLGVPGVPLLAGDADDNDVGFGMTLGYRFNRNIAIELGYVDLGKLEADVVDAAGTSDAQAALGFSADGMTFALVGTFPIGKWEPYLKAGVLFSNTELEYSGSFSATAFSNRLSDDSEDALYGIGVRYALRERLQLYLDSTYFSEVGESGGGQSDFLSTSLGVMWRF